MALKKINIKFLEKIINLNRIIKQLIMVLFDGAIILFVLLASFSMRLDKFYWPSNEDIAWVIYIAPLIAIPVFYSFRLYRSVVRYIGFKALWSIAMAVSLYAVIWGLLGYEISRINSLPMDSGGIPRSVILINWMLSIIIIGGSRVLARWFFNNEYILNSGEKNSVIVYGAGSAGRQLSYSLQLSPGYKHVAYIDDNLAMERAYVDNIPVFSYNDIEKLIERNGISDIFLALPSVSRKKRKKIIEKLSQFSVHVRSLPSVSDLAGNKVKIDDLLEIDIRDLLGRIPVQPNETLLKVKISNKVVMVTGAGGSIGSELCRQISYLKPKQLILFDISEAALYPIEQEMLKIGFSTDDVIPIIGSVCNRILLDRILKLYKVNTIYHAAAYKHVPLVESNPAAGVLNNSMGTLIIAESAISSNVETFVLISTDKAVRPTNVMGASKRVAELVLQSFAKQSNNTCFTMVRFGNVLDSSGSVIPLFRRQIKEGGPITVTDPNVVRYFMTIPEAVELVIQAGAMSLGGDVFVLDMGEPIKIIDLAYKMIHLSGLTPIDNENPDGDINIEFTGLRPGEKLFEELLIGNNVIQSEHPRIMQARESKLFFEDVISCVEVIKLARIEQDEVIVKELLLKYVDGYTSELI